MIEGKKSLYEQLRDADEQLRDADEQLRDADEDIRKMTPDKWPDKLLDNMKPLDPEYSKVVDENFWSLI